MRRKQTAIRVALVLFAVVLALGLVVVPKLMRIKDNSIPRKRTSLGSKFDPEGESDSSRLSANARYQFALGNDDEALKMIELEPNILTRNMNKGYMHFVRGEYEQAANCFRQYSKFSDGEPPIETGRFDSRANFCQALCEIMKVLTQEESFDPEVESKRIAGIATENRSDSGKYAARFYAILSGDLKEFMQKKVEDFEWSVEHNSYGEYLNFFGEACVLAFAGGDEIRKHFFSKYSEVPNYHVYSEDQTALLKELVESDSRSGNEYIRFIDNLKVIPASETLVSDRKLDEAMIRSPMLMYPIVFDEVFGHKGECRLTVTNKVHDFCMEIIADPKKAGTGYHFILLESFTLDNCFYLLAFGGHKELAKVEEFMRYNPWLEYDPHDTTIEATRMEAWMWLKIACTFKRKFLYK